MDEKVGRLLAFIGLRPEIAEHPERLQDAIARLGGDDSKGAGATKPDDGAAAAPAPREQGDQVERPEVNPFLGAGEGPAASELPLEQPKVEEPPAESRAIETAKKDDADTDVMEAYAPPEEGEARDVEEAEPEHRQRDDDDEAEGRGAGWVAEDREEPGVEDQPGLREARALGDDTRCSGRVADGSRCLRKAIEGTPYCREHAATARTIEGGGAPAAAADPPAKTDEPPIGARGSRIIV
jgi:hypothetical protein